MIYARRYQTMRFLIVRPATQIRNTDVTLCPKLFEKPAFLRSMRQNDLSYWSETRGPLQMEML